MKTFGKICMGIGLITVGVGIALLILAAGVGGSWKHISTFSHEESYEAEGIKSMDVQIGYGNVKLVEGSQFNVNAQNIPKNCNFESYVKDGVWYIKETGGSFVNLFGYDISIGVTSWHNNAPQVTITVPEGFRAEDFCMKLNTGRLKADMIRSITGNIGVDAGEMEIDQLDITKSSEYKLGTGHMLIHKMAASNVSVDCNIGEIKMDGTIKGENVINCDIGHVGMNLEGEPDNYSYDVDSDIGNVIINGNSYHKRYVGSKTGETDGSFDLNCNIGNITLEY